MKAALTYVVIVGGSLLALIAILRFGRHLDAPPSVGGRWRIDSVRPAAAERSPCLEPPNGAELRVFQSGVHVIVVLHDSVLRGELKGNRLRARAVRVGPETPRPHACPNARQFQLDAVVGGAQQARLLDATLSLPDCSACGAVSLHAARIVREIG